MYVQDYVIVVTIIVFIFCSVEEKIQWRSEAISDEGYKAKHVTDLNGFRRDHAQNAS